MHAVNGEYDDGTGVFARKGKPDRAMAEKLIFNEDYNKINGDVSLLVKEFNTLVKNVFHQMSLRKKTMQIVCCL